MYVNKCVSVMEALDTSDFSNFLIFLCLDVDKAE